MGHYSHLHSRSSFELFLCYSETFSCVLAYSNYGWMWTGKTFWGAGIPIQKLMDSFKYCCRKASAQMLNVFSLPWWRWKKKRGRQSNLHWPVRNFFVRSTSNQRILLILFILAGHNFSKATVCGPFWIVSPFHLKKIPWGKAQNVASSSASGFSEPLVNLTNFCQESWQWGWTMRETFLNSNFSRASRTWNSCNQLRCNQ